MCLYGTYVHMSTGRRTAEDSRRHVARFRIAGGGATGEFAPEYRVWLRMLLGPKLQITWEKSKTAPLQPYARHLQCRSTMIYIYYRYMMSTYIYIYVYIHIICDVLVYICMRYLYLSRMTHSYIGYTEKAKCVVVAMSAPKRKVRSTARASGSDSRGSTSHPWRMRRSSM